MPVKFKFKRPDTMTRYAFFDGRPSWEGLASKITELFPIHSDHVAVAFIEADNGPAMLTNDQDLQNFYQLLAPSSSDETIKFVVQDKQAPDGESALHTTKIASTWSTGSNLSDLSKSGNELKLFCWVLDEPYSTFSVNIEKNKIVDDLKEEIKKKTDPVSAEIAYNALDLWKPNDFNPITAKPSDTLANRIRSLGDSLSQISDKLEPTDNLFSIFPKQPPNEYLHIIVKVPATPRPRIRLYNSSQFECLDSIDKSPKKRRRVDEFEFDGAPDPNLAGLHRLFWGIVDSDCFQEYAVVIPNIRTLSVEEVPPSKSIIITLRDGTVFPFKMPSILVTSVYKEFWELITADEKRWQDPQRNPWLVQSSHATIIKGQPGIGKTVFLSYVLVRRLQAKLPTVYCDNTGYVHIFSDSGVTKVQLRPGSQISEFETNVKCCALVNIGPQVEQPPLQFFPHTRKGRVVVATSPNLSHIKAFSKEWPGISYCMPTWNWGELYVASLLWMGKLADPAGEKHSESLRDVFTKYRGVPRICLLLYSEFMLDYESDVENAITNIPNIEDLIASTKGPLPFKDNTIHRLVTIEPTPQSRKQTSTEITSPHIARLLFNKFRQYERYQVSRLIKQLLTQPDTRGYGDVIFEQLVHEVFCKGITFEAEGMSTKAPHLRVSIYPNDQEASYFYHLRNTRAAKGSQDIALSYLNRYMIPILKNKESIDSVWLSNDCTVLFQITVSKNHPLKSHGIRTLLKELPANAKKNVRIVFVLPLGDEETSSFGEQTITPEIGGAKNVTEEIQNYPQYVYRFDYVNSLNAPSGALSAS